MNVVNTTYGKLEPKTFIYIYFTGKKVFHDLAKKCDVMVENFVPGKLDELDVGYETLSRLNPQLIYCAITGFGPTGPYAKKPG